MHKQIILLLTLFYSICSNAQITGTVSDSSGEPLPLVSIYVQGSSTGTTTNLEGIYQLNLAPGTYELVYQFIGYETQVERIEIERSPIALDVILSEQALLINEIVVAADAEDPAYRVIREAIKKRDYYNTLHDQYACEVYVKGYNKILDAPEKILGIEVGDLEGALDSNRQGIVYLSESISKLYYSSPDTYKEVVTSSKISGDDQGYSFNSAAEMQFNIYKNTETLERAIILPIADNALTYYRYRLDGTFYDQEGRLINKIKVIPKSATDPVVSGYIYIVEDVWNVHSLDLNLSKEASQVYFLDTLSFEQVFIPIAGSDDRSLFSNIITFQFGGLGFVIEGEFTAIYNGYDYEPKLDKSFFKHVTHVVEEGSNERDSAYWEAVRPVPLTTFEQRDYIQKDSIREIREAPAFKDSLDREYNKFSIGDLLSGYSFRNSNTRQYLDVGSILSGLSYNTVQGLKARVDLNYRKYFDEKETRRILYWSTLDYGLSEKKLRYSGNLVYRPNRTTSTEFALFGGSSINQFNNTPAIPTLYNTIYTLVDEQNFARYYAKTQLGFRWQTDIIPGLVLNSSIRYEDRTQLSNTTDFVIFDRDERFFQPNIPTFETDFLTGDQALIFNANLRIRFGQKYSVFPDRRFSDGYVGPQLRLSYAGAINQLGGDASYHKISLNLGDNVTLGIKGDFSYFAEAGTFLSDDQVPFVDRFHFQGNELLIYPTGFSRNTFLNLPYYDFSTAGSFVQAHLNHDFNGWILGRIPVLKKTGFSLVAGARVLETSDNPTYWEFNVGLNKIGWDLFRILKVDVVWSVQSGQPTQRNLRFGIGL